jgi:hypothetical protein
VHKRGKLNSLQKVNVVSVNHSKASIASSYSRNRKASMGLFSSERMV